MSFKKLDSSHYALTKAIIFSTVELAEKLDEALAENEVLRAKLAEAEAELLKWRK